MREGKEHAPQTQQPVALNEGPVASTSGGIPLESNIRDKGFIQPSTSQPSDPDGQSRFTARSGSQPDSRVYQDILIDCNALIESYRKGEISKPSVYVEIQSRLARALSDNRERSDAAFGSFIATIKSHDLEIEAAATKGRAVNPLQHSTSPPLSDSDGQHSEGEPSAKRVKVDESAFAWIASRQHKYTILQDSLTKTLKLIESYTIDPKATKQSLVNELDCPEFPDSEWKNIIARRAVSLDAVLSGQLSTTHNDPKVENFGDLEITFGAVEPTKIIRNGGDWSITWNRTVRATIFTFPHRVEELSSYGEYIVNLFTITHPSMHSRVITFNKAVRKRVGSVQNLELSNFEKFSDLKIVHMDSIGVSVISRSSKDNGKWKGKKGKNWKKDEPCNNWNDGKCSQVEEDC